MPYPQIAPHALDGNVGVQLKKQLHFAEVFARVCLGKKCVAADFVAVRRMHLSIIVHDVPLLCAKVLKGIFSKKLGKEEITQRNDFLFGPEIQRKRKVGWDGQARYRHKVGELLLEQSLVMFCFFKKENPVVLLELNRLKKLLEDNPGLKIQINGHTDDVGTEEDNLQLSNNRAKAVYDFLVQNGVDPERLKYKGFGEARPVVSNESPESRQQNRRTEFVIIQ